MSLNTGQKAVADQFMDFMLDAAKPYMIIEGHAGTGKTYLTDQLIKMVETQLKLVSLLMGHTRNSHIQVDVTATTNKAARVIADTLGREPQTIHKLLNLIPHKNFRTGKISFSQGKKSLLQPNSLIIIDEAGFIEKPLLDKILECCKNCKILFIGDPFQLLAVGSKSSAVFDSNFPKGVLTDLVRNPGPIGTLADSFRRVLLLEDWPTIVPNNKEILHVDGHTFRSMIDQEFSRKARCDDDARILAWSNERVAEYNKHIREILNYGDTLAVGEHLISNSYMPSFNIAVDQHLTILENYGPRKQEGVEGHFYKVSGDNSIFVPNDPTHITRVLNNLRKQSKWKEYYRIKETWGDFRPPYASTIHKSQGSTYKCVFVDLNDIGRCNSPLDVARLLYVAVSRASTKVVFYGDLPEKYGGKL